MIEGLDTLLAGEKHSGLQELRALLLEKLGGEKAMGRLLDHGPLSRNRVHRVEFEVQNQRRSLVVKRLPLQRSDREQKVTNRWLPRVHLQAHAPPLLGVALERRGEAAWHVYEDLGPHALVDCISDPHKVSAAVDVIAKLHMRFAHHPLLAECRLAGGDLGVRFFEASLRDATTNIECMLRDPTLDTHSRTIAARLDARLKRLAQEQQRRANTLAELGGPETLLHGDLWTCNILVVPCAHGLDVRLIDWESCGVGPIAYDLSAFLRRFPVSQRLAVLKSYQASVAAAKWTWPTLAQLNEMFDTAELARLANCVTWAAVAITQTPPPAPDWAVEDLEEIDTWFENLSPVLPLDGKPSAHGEAAAA
jgi:aminoglycoside/choline kinase family phosphotransferase